VLGAEAASLRSAHRLPGDLRRGLLREACTRWPPFSTSAVTAYSSWSASCCAIAAIIAFPKGTVNPEDRCDGRDQRSQETHCVRSLCSRGTDLASITPRIHALPPAVTWRAQIAAGTRADGTRDAGQQPEALSPARYPHLGRQPQADPLHHPSTPVTSGGRRAIGDHGPSILRGQSAASMCPCRTQW
jgi:hypothetical protein